MAFSDQEREALGLHGLLPPHVASLEEQLGRRYHNFCQQKDPLVRYMFLSHLHGRNETLFYSLLLDHLEEMLPLVYTPTIGDVSLEFSLLYDNPHGIYFSYSLRHKIIEIVNNIPAEELDIVIATDGERILGLGDVGIGGMAISQGKSILYTLFGGIPPGRILPVMIDVGTNNQALLEDPFYLGWRHPRITGKEYEEFIEQIVTALQRRYPKILLQWEDFAKANAHSLLERYRKKICSFNDDIQGTAAVVLAAVLSGVKAKKEEFCRQKIVIFGGGSAGMGIARLLLSAMGGEAHSAFYILDVQGLVHTRNASDPQHTPFARDYEEVCSWSASSRIDLLDVIEQVHPDILIGVSAQSGAFHEIAIRSMARHCPRPIILPLSNPCSRSEAKPADLIAWTEGRGIIATGSPFSPVEYQGRSYPIAQCNNLCIFPGIGLAATSCKIHEITEQMFIEAAQVLSDASPLLQDPSALLFPALSSLRTVSQNIALRVCQIAQPRATEEVLQQVIKERIWTPRYNP